MSTILIVDACATSRELAAGVLARNGHDVLQAAGRDTALVMLACDGPELALVHPAATQDDSALLSGLRIAAGRGLCILSWTDAPEQIARLSAAGACGFVPRLTGSMDLLVGQVERALATGGTSASLLREALRDCAAAA